VVMARLQLWLDLWVWWDGVGTGLGKQPAAGAGSSPHGGSGSGKHSWVAQLVRTSSSCAACRGKAILRPGWQVAAAGAHWWLLPRRHRHHLQLLQETCHHRCCRSRWSCGPIRGLLLQETGTAGTASSWSVQSNCVRLRCRLAIKQLDERPVGFLKQSCLSRASVSRSARCTMPITLYCFIQAGMSSEGTSSFSPSSSLVAIRIQIGASSLSWLMARYLHSASRGNAIALPARGYWRTRWGCYAI
jgi:hypothetical protein